MKIEIRFPDGDRVRGSLRSVAESMQANALRQATARAAGRGQTVAKREIVKEYAIKYGDAGRAFRIERNVTDASGAPAAAIIASGKRGRNVIAFLKGQRGRKRTRGPKPQLQFEIRRGHTVTIAQAFVVTHNRGTFVAQQVAPDIRKLKGVSTIDFPRMFSARRVMDYTMRQISELFLPEETTRGLRDAINRATRS